MMGSLSPHFHVRRATAAADDGARCLQFFDSQLAWLSSKGSAGQWGTTSRGKDPKRLAEHREQMEFIDKSFEQPWDRDSARAWIVEVEETAGGDSEQLETPTRLAAGGLILKGQASDYVRKVIPEQQDVDDPYVYLYLLITNRDAGAAARGAGAALIELAKSETRKLGYSRLCVDCWRGNGRRLVQYYESQGFQLVGEFDIEKPDDTIWEGAVLDMRV